MGGNVALIVAAGRGRRLGGEAPKQYLRLAGRSVLSHAAAAFTRHPRINAVRVVIHPDDRDTYTSSLNGMALLPPVNGGTTRQESVRLGLESLTPEAPDHVLIHDAARPLVPRALIDNVLDALARHPGAIPAIGIADTLKQVAEGVITGSPSREGVWRAQTPQGFRFPAILDAHRRAAGAGDSEYTDDAAVAAAAGLAVATVPGSEDNLKITTADDLARASGMLLSGLETRTGLGFDAHAFDGTTPGPVRVCGVDIPYAQGLAGHSDADTGLHALTDAILGAVGAGDIGVHFPSSDPRWKGADSAIFLSKAMDVLKDADGWIVNADVTLICAAPRVGPHRDAMRARVAALLGVETGRISVKATTTDGLGAFGRGEGIAAQAIVSVAVPVPGGRRGGMSA